MGDERRKTSDERKNDDEKVMRPTLVLRPLSFVAYNFRDEVTKAYVELGLTESDAALNEVAKAIAGLGL